MFQFRALPPKEAVDYFEQKGYKIGFGWEDVWQSEHQAAFTVAKVMQLDILRDIRAGVDAALKDGTTFETFRQNLKPLLMEKGWWGKAEMADPLTGESKLVQLGSTRRLRTIFDTNLRTAYSEGQWQRIQQTKKSFPILIYHGNNSEHPRMQHSGWDNLALPADDPFWKAHFPVKAWGCKCFVTGANQKMLDQRGLKVGESPKVPEYTYTNTRTGEIQKIPLGVDPGFNYPPGGRMANLPKFVTEKLDASEPVIAAAALRDLVAGAAFKSFYDHPEGAFPIAVIPDSHAAEIGAKAHTVRLSAETMQKQIEVHPEITAEEYSVVQRTIDVGEKMQDTGKSLIYLLSYEKNGYVSVIRAERIGKTVFLTSFKRVSAKEAKKLKDIKKTQNGKNGV